MAWRKVLLFWACLLVVPAILSPRAAMAQSCSATADDGVTVYSADDAAAVREAVDAAPEGSTVKIGGYCAGVAAPEDTSSAPSTESAVVHLDKPITLRGGYHDGDWQNSDPLLAPTVLDASGAGRVVYATAPVTIENLTLFNGFAIGDGGGIFAAADVSVRSSAVVSNAALGDGAGIYAGGVATLEGVEVATNRAGSSRLGGGAYLGSGGFLHEVRWLDNGFADLGDGQVCGIDAGCGGALYSSGDLSAANVAFLRNRATLGGALMQDSGASEIHNALFARNSAGEGGAILWASSQPATLSHSTLFAPLPRAGSAVQLVAGSLAVTNSIFAGYPVALSAAHGVIAEDYNLFFDADVVRKGAVAEGLYSQVADPQFVAPLDDNYRLQPESPGIDAAAELNLSRDIEGNSRSLGYAPDMGAYEARFSAEADVAVALSVSDPLLPSQPLTYTLDIRNLGPGPAFAIDITDVLPGNLSLSAIDAAVSPPDLKLDGLGVPPNLAWKLASLPSAGNVRITLVGTLDPGSAAGGAWLTNTAEAMAANDGATANNVAMQAVRMPGATLTLRTAVVGPFPSEPWEYTGSLGTITQPPDGGAVTLSYLPAGSYSLEATSKPHYRTQVACDRGEVGSSVVLFSLDVGDSANCLFVHFRQAQVTVALQGTGSGRVASLPQAIDCGAICSSNVDVSTTLTLTAAPAKGSVFAGWSFPCGPSPHCAVTLIESRVLFATFELDSDGDGLGNVQDLDDDNDGLADEDEIRRGTNPLLSDTDGDRHDDGQDNCPLAANGDQSDADVDGLGDACEEDTLIRGLELITSAPTKIGAVTEFTTTHAAGSNVTLEWDFGDGTPRQRQGPNPDGQMGSYRRQHTYSKPGTYMVTVEAYNGANRISVQKRLEVFDVPASSLFAVFSSVDGKALRAGGEIEFRAETRRPVEALLFLWDFGDGAQAQGPLVRHAYARPGTYEVRLVASGAGSRQAAAITIEVLPAEEQRPSGKGLFLPYLRAAQN